MNPTTRDELLENVRIVKGVLSGFARESTKEWLASQIAKHERIIEESRAAIEIAKRKHAEAPAKVRRTRQDLERAKRALVEHDNRRSIDQLKRLMTKVNTEDA